MSGWRKRQIENMRAAAEIHAGDGEYSIGTREEYEKFAKARNVSLGRARIRELEEQSYVTVKDENQFDCTVFSKQKFAELIVRECARVAWNTQYKPVPLQIGSSSDCSNAIKQHFGVE